MAEGQEQINNALKLIYALLEQWAESSKDIAKRLKKVATTLEEISGKLFLKTKAALPHTSIILKATEDLKNSSNISGSNPSDEFNDVLEQLDSETEILKLKVANRDIVIT